MTSRRSFLRQLSALAAAPAIARTFSTAASAQPTDAALDRLAQDLARGSLGQVVRPGAAAHNKIKYYNARFDCVKTTTYLRPASAEGVQKIIEWANANKRTMGIRGGGHSFEGKSSHPQLVIDMSHLNQFRFDSADGTLEVQAGVPLGEVYKTLGAAGFVIPAGTCPSVGIVGHTLGGGIGDFLPMFGYAAQSLREVTLVTMAGTRLKVSDQKVEVLGGRQLDRLDSDPALLMRVLRGGGQGTLGVVTGMTFKAHDVRNAKIASFKLEGADRLSPERAVAILEAWQNWRKGLPEEMQGVVSSKVNFGRSGNRYSIEILGLMVIPAASRLDISAVRRSLDSLFQLPELGNSSLSRPLNATGAINSFLDDDETTNNPKRRILYGSSSVLPDALPRRALDHFVRNVPAGVYVSLYSSGGKTKSGPPTSVQPSEFLMEWVSWGNRRDPATYGKIRSVNLEMMSRAGFKPFGFPNYCDHEERDYYPNKAEIAALRSRLDPAGLSTSSLLSDAKQLWAQSSCR